MFPSVLLSLFSWGGRSHEEVGHEYSVQRQRYQGYEISEKESTKLQRKTNEYALVGKAYVLLRETVIDLTFLSRQQLLSC